MKRESPPLSQSVDASHTLKAERYWRVALSSLAVSILWILAWYAPTARSMAEIWARSDTFAHGFIVPPIVVWLIWRMRAQIAQLTPRPAWWAVGLLAIAGMGWLSGELAAVNAMSQLALTVMLILTVIALLGTQVARQIAFPLAFLLFAVPIGEFIMPQLMEWTADITIAALRLSGIPVYREGQQFIIPTGHWSVVEACSGLRYLIASVTVGTLYAYLTYYSLTRRLLFIGVSILVPIIANWVRAYMIVMLGHLSGNKLAVGVDHLIYGWLFFGLVIALMFWVGTRWREDHHPQVVAPTKPVAKPTSVRDYRPWTIVTAAALMIAVWKIGYWTIERSDASATPQLALLEGTREWLPVAGSARQWRPNFVNPPAELLSTFQREEQEVGIFIGYYRNQRSDRKLVSSENVLLKTTDSTWAQVGGGMREITFNGEPLTVRTAELRSANQQRVLAWQWYWINGRLTANDYVAKAYTLLSRLRGRGDDSAVIVVYAPQPLPGTAHSALEAFVQAAAPSIDLTLRAARERR